MHLIIYCIAAASVSPCAALPAAAAASIPATAPALQLLLLLLRLTSVGAVATPVLSFSCSFCCCSFFTSCSCVYNPFAYPLLLPLLLLLLVLLLQAVRSAFAVHGSVKDVYLPLDYHSRMPRGFGFVEFWHRADAERALEKMDGFELDGKAIEVAIAKKGRSAPQQMVRYLQLLLLLLLMLLMPLMLLGGFQALQLVVVLLLLHQCFPVMPLLHRLRLVPLQMMIMLIDCLWSSLLLLW